MSKYPQNTMHVKIMYGWTNGTNERTPNGHRTFAPVDLTAPKVAAGKNLLNFTYFSINPLISP